MVKTVFKEALALAESKTNQRERPDSGYEAIKLWGLTGHNKTTSVLG
jgi:hypothetical protein